MCVRGFLRDLQNSAEWKYEKAASLEYDNSQGSRGGCACAGATYLFMKVTGVGGSPRRSGVLL
jgi:hypothetical protein